MLARRDYENRKISLLETNQKILEKQKFFFFYFYFFFLLI
jgi:hypothetical protein